MRARARPTLHRLVALGLVGGLLCVGCVSRPTASEMVRLEPESPARKAMQTRSFETPGSNELLSASAAVLQDLGFQVTESDRDLGFLRAAKERSAREYGQEISQTLVVLLSTLGSLAGSNMVIIHPVDLHQQINASLVAQPLRGEEERQQLRIVFYRLIWKGDGAMGNQYIPPGEQKMEMIHDPEIYQTFFARLSKAVFLEAHKI